KVNYLLENAHWLTIAKENTQLISQREVKLGNYLGREIKAKNSGVLVKVRSYVIKNRLYSLILLVPPPGLTMLVEPLQWLRFFHSFQLTDSWAIDAEAQKRRAKSWRFFAEPTEGVSVWFPVEADAVQTFDTETPTGQFAHYLLANHGGVVYWLLHMQTPEEA